MMRRFLTTSVLFLLATAAAATTSSQAEADTMAASILDTKENRVAQAKRVLLGQPIEETLEGIVQEAVKVKGVEYSEVRSSSRGCMYGLPVLAASRHPPLGPHT